MTTQQPLRVLFVDAPVAPDPHTAADRRNPRTRPATERQARSTALGTRMPPHAATRPTAATGHAATRGDV